MFKILNKKILSKPSYKCSRIQPRPYSPRYNFSMDRHDVEFYGTDMILEALVDFSSRNGMGMYKYDRKYIM